MGLENAASSTVKKQQQAVQNGYANNPNRQIATTNNPYDPNLYNTSFTPGNTDNLYSADPDVRIAQQNLNAYNFGNRSGNNVQYHETGVGQAYQQAANRVALKKALAESITNAPIQEQQEESLMQQQANSALGEGLKNTRRNYSDRGLLYSGLRQGAEQGVRGSVASALAGQQGEARHNLENLLTKQKAAFASIHLGDYQQKLNDAQAAFESSYQSSIARQQAAQQLYGGIGMGAGMLYGMRGNSNTGASTDVNNPSWNSSLGNYNFNNQPSGYDSSFWNRG